MKVRLEWKPQDLWIGAFWQDRGPIRHLWICLLPMLPIHFAWVYRGMRPHPMEVGCTFSDDRCPNHDVCTCHVGPKPTSRPKVNSRCPLHGEPAALSPRAEREDQP